MTVPCIKCGKPVTLERLKQELDAGHYPPLHVECEPKAESKISDLFDVIGFGGRKENDDE